MGVHFLRNASLFANLATSDLEALAERLVPRRYNAGDHILTQGSPSSSLYIVKSGRVAIIVTGAAGDAQPVAEFGPGQVFGEFALLDGLPRSAGAVARERSELLVLDRPEFFMYLEQHPAVAIKLLVLLSRRLRFTLQRTEDTASPVSSQTQLAGVLVRLAERYGQPDGDGLRLPMRLTQGELAGIMGRPRSETERALTALQQQGVIEMRGVRMTICNLAALQGLAAAQD